MNEDDRHLGWLTTAYYVATAVIGLGACIPLIHVAIGLIFLISPPAMAPRGEPFPAKLFGLLFASMGGIAVLLGWSIAGCAFVVARSIASRRRYTFCIVLAAFLCFFMPLGTILGVLTIVVLVRPTVKEQFSSTTVSDPFMKSKFE